MANDYDLLEPGKREKNESPSGRTGRVFGHGKTPLCGMWQKGRENGLRADEDPSSQTRKDVPDGKTRALNSTKKR